LFSCGHLSIPDDFKAGAIVNYLKVHFNVR
jgi:hypothetical protein